jgi:hypothetical protein
MKLTAPQKNLLVDVDNGVKYVTPSYKPAAKLVELGLCTLHTGRMGNDWLELTDAGRAELKRIRP